MTMLSTTTAEKPTKESLLTKDRVKSLKISDHAVQRVKERFKQKNKSDCLNYCKGILGQPDSRYIGVSTCEQGNQAHEFCLGKIVVYISLDMTTVVTAMRIKDKQYLSPTKTLTPVRELPILHDKIVALYDSAYKQHDRLESKKVRQLEKEKIERGVRIAELELRIYKTKSAKVKQTCEQELAEVKAQIILLEQEIKQIQDNKRKISRAKISLMA